MTTAPASANETRPLRRRGWGQFSLVSLLLLAVIGCLVGAYIAELRRRQAAEAVIRQKDAEIRQNRIDLGLLDDQPNVLNVSDPTKVHIRQLPSYDPGTAWRWRIYLPPRTQWQLKVSDGDSMDESGRFSGSGAATDFTITGEFTLEGRIVRHINGRPYVEFKWGKGGFGGSLPESGITILQANGQRSLHIAGQKAQETFAPDAAIDLVRQHVRIPENQPLPAGKTLPGERETSREYGFSAYFEPGSMMNQVRRRPAGPSTSRQEPGD